MYKSKDVVDSDKYDFDVVAMGELLIDFTQNDISTQGNPLFEANPGGAPCNVLSMLQNLGKTTGFIGKVGKDQFGAMLKDVIDEIGIDSRGLVIDEEVNTTLAFIHTADDGDRDFSFYRKPGADMMLRADEVSEEVISKAKIFHFGSLSMTDTAVEEATRKALDIAKDNQVLISFDPNLREPLWDSLDQAKEKIQYGISQCDILKISEDELEFITGTKDIDEGVKIINEIKPLTLVCVTCGKDGSFAFHQGIKVFVAGFPQDTTIETTGAGDTFCGCMINYVLESGILNLQEELDEMQLKEMLIFANAAASIITTRRGALKVMPTKEEVEEFILKA